MCGKRLNNIGPNVGRQGNDYSIYEDLVYYDPACKSSYHAHGKCYQHEVNILYDKFSSIQEVHYEILVIVMMDNILAVIMRIYEYFCGKRTLLITVNTMQYAVIFHWTMINVITKMDTKLSSDDDTVYDKYYEPVITLLPLITTWIIMVANIVITVTVQQSTSSSTKYVYGDPGYNDDPVHPCYCIITLTIRIILLMQHLLRDAIWH